MGKPVIAFDMDDTLAHFVEPALKKINQIIQGNIKEHELTSGMWIDDLLTPEQYKIVEQEIFNIPFYQELTSTCLTTDLVLHQHKKILKDAFSWHTITARGIALGVSALEITDNWLRVRGVYMDGITITKPSESKVLAAPRSMRVIVEDSATVASDALSHGVIVVLISKPWNTHLESHENLIRVEKHHEVVPTLLQLHSEKRIG